MLNHRCVWVVLASILLLTVDWFYIATPLNAQWVRVQGSIPTNVTVRAFASYTNGSGERILFAGTEGAGIFLSTNDGASWTAVNNGLTDLTVYSLTISGKNIFAGTEIGGIFRSTNNGTSWSTINAGFTGSEVYSFAVSDTNIYAGAFWGGVFRSNNNGNSWSNSGLYYVLSLLKTDTYLYAGTGASQVYRSTDYGSSWLPAESGLLQTTYNALAVTPNGSGGTNLFAGSYWDSSGVFLSTDNGVNWNQFNEGLTNKQVYALAASGSNLFAGTLGFEGGVFHLTNIASNWVAVNEGFSHGPFVVSLYISGNYLFAGTLSGVWRRPLSEMVTSIEGTPEIFPAQFILEQNYPNPFNPSTTIRFSIPVGTHGHTSLRVYDLLGREVATLVNEVKQPGSYEVTWDASGFASGVYLYRLQSGNFVQTRRLLLLR
jgi:photosystem II stability/assembly factor-like uncharacterized protein